MQIMLKPKLKELALTGIQKNTQKKELYLQSLFKNSFCPLFAVSENKSQSACAVNLQRKQFHEVSVYPCSHSYINTLQKSIMNISKRPIFTMHVSGHLHSKFLFQTLLNTKISKIQLSLLSCQYSLKTSNPLYENVIFIELNYA